MLCRVPLSSKALPTESWSLWRPEAPQCKNPPIWCIIPFKLTGRENSKRQQFIFLSEWPLLGPLLFYERVELLSALVFSQLAQEDTCTAEIQCAAIVQASRIFCGIERLNPPELTLSTARCKELVNVWGVQGWNPEVREKNILLPKMSHIKSNLPFGANSSQCKLWMHC